MDLSEAYSESRSGKFKKMIQTIQIMLIRTTWVIYCQSSKSCWVKLYHRILDCQGCPSKISNLFYIWSISIYLFLCCKQFQGAKQWQFACWWFLSSKTTKLIIQRLITKQIFFVVIAVYSFDVSHLISFSNFSFHILLIVKSITHFWIFHEQNDVIRKQTFTSTVFALLWDVPHCKFMERIFINLWLE